MKSLNITSWGVPIPFSERIILPKSDMYIIDEFLDLEECERLIAHISPIKGPAKNMALRADNVSISREVNQRICKLMGIIDTSDSPLWVCQFEDSSHFLEALTNTIQSRMVFLVFLSAGHGEVDPVNIAATRHAAGRALILDVEARTQIRWDTSEKPLLIKEISSDKERIKKQPGEYFEPITRRGFEKFRLKDSIHKRLLEYYVRNKCFATPESATKGFIASLDGSVPSLMIELPEYSRQTLLGELKPLVEEWCRRPVVPTHVYGIRVYLFGATLTSHRDLPTTHVLGASINLEQDSVSAWPLMIEDHFCRTHEIYIGPGEVLLFEAARLAHGRPVPFNGRSHANVFCHFVPID